MYHTLSFVHCNNWPEVLSAAETAHIDCEGLRASVGPGGRIRYFRYEQDEPYDVTLWRDGADLCLLTHDGLSTIQRDALLRLALSAISAGRLC